jgi:hypothetical protein
MKLFSDGRHVKHIVVLSEIDAVIKPAFDTP